MIYEDFISNVTTNYFRKIFRHLPRNKSTTQGTCTCGAQLLMKRGQFGIQNKCLKAVYMYELFFILLIFSSKLCITRYALYVHGNTLL